MKAALLFFLLLALLSFVHSQQQQQQQQHQQQPLSLFEKSGPPIPSNNSNFGAALDNDVISFVLNLVAPPIVEGILTTFGENLPQDCCYATSTHERLIIKDAAIPSDSITTSVTVTDGPHVDMEVDFALTMHYKLCQKAEFTCPPLYPCVGDARLGMKARIQFDLILKSGPKGGPDIRYDHVKLHLKVNKHDLCFLLTGLLDVLMPFLNIFIEVFVPKALGPVVHSIELPHNISIPGPLPMNIDWTLTEGTDSEKPGIGIQGILDVLLRSLNYQAAPFVPNYRLPLASDNLKDHESTFELTDSFVNNILFVVSHHFNDFEIDTKTNGFKVKFQFNNQPIVNFTSLPGNQATLLTLNTHVSLTKLPLKVVVNSIEEVHFTILFNENNQLYLSINPTDFVVDIYSMTPPQPNSTKNAIQNQIESAFDSIIPKLNSIFEAHPVALPFPPKVESPSLTYFDGYVRFMFDTDDKSGEEKTINPIPIVEPANVIDFSGKNLIEKMVDSATPMGVNFMEVMWEAMGSENPDEYLPYVLSGLPEGRVLSCPSLPLFKSC